MTWLIRLALSAGVPERLAKPVLIAALVALAILGAGIAKCSYDRSIIAKHDAAANLDAVTEGRKADATAATQRTADQARSADETAQLEKVMRDATNPDDRRAAFYECVRKQQAARANGQRSPAC